jgi:alkylated DNA repair dioxygenase AlkB
MSAVPLLLVSRTVSGRRTAEPPVGFVYRPRFVSPEEEQQLVEDIQALEFSEVRMRGQVARRRTVHFGWLYGYDSWRVEPGPPIPASLLPLRARAAGLGGVAADALAEVLVTEYVPGAGIGWHRDAPMFGIVVGVSLLGECRFRMRRKEGAGYVSASIVLEPRSAYVLAGEARARWQHSIPASAALRYSVTFRTLRSRAARTPAPLPGT